MLRTSTSADLPDLALEALGNAERRRLVRSLASGAKSVGELAAEVPISRPAVSRHLRQLESAGLVAHQAEGTRNVYRLDQRGMQQAATWLTRFWDDAEARLRLVAENTEPKVRQRG
jgi:DNA-binding transcriptional ArsR family regulator